MALQNKNNLKIGVCDIYYNGIDMGATKGGVTLEYGQSYTPMTVDQFGETPVDFSLLGEELSAILRLAELQLETMKMAMPMATEQTNGTLTLGKNAGERLDARASVLRLHPQVMGADKSEDIVIYRAVSMEPISLEYKIDEQQIFETKMTGLVDLSKGNGLWLGHRGDYAY